MEVEIDKYAGFCFGVTRAIKTAEDLSADDDGIYCLGQIVHNAQEEDRLKRLGMSTIDHSVIPEIGEKKMLIRAHGEPPQTYANAKKNNVEIIDATCPVVLNLQKRIKDKFTECPDCQIVIFGKKGHAEVNGLVGQTDGNATVISNIEEADILDISKPIFLFSQTTSNYKEYCKIESYLKEKSLKVLCNIDNITVYQTICPSVKNRIPRLKDFCKQHDIIIFVSDYKSSNGNMLYKVCEETNPKSYFLTHPDEVKKEWLKNTSSVGISGATSTPLWLMQDVKSQIENLLTI
ncbi:MAG: 4-hydroxy-3-methylbut-2-enyl diphosphate reductase [Marinilabiliales bacterium]|nr:MAG: 4-hydroxy-3-methylbut-2-enyl diphosphate reductase [Marinilabiliales bacterium]